MAEYQCPRYPFQRNESDNFGLGFEGIPASVITNFLILSVISYYPNSFLQVMLVIYLLTKHLFWDFSGIKMLSDHTEITFKMTTLTNISTRTSYFQIWVLFAVTAVISLLYLIFVSRWLRYLYNLPFKPRGRSMINSILATAEIAEALLTSNFNQV
ncbi:hypothetical protein Ciccas_005186 [Cichlidogyrus casuarinus]|uniref:Uncharacterized protein n=1 Tax=Cichlidogyrus casuarinus TaxID=1844966 RepID=A0ABD2QCY6_9PLAT